MKLPAALKPENVVALVDHREQTPLDLTPLRTEQVIGSLLGWTAAGLSVHMAGDHQRAGRHAARLLFTVAKRRYRELRAMCDVVPQTPEEPIK